MRPRAYFAYQRLPPGLHRVNVARRSAGNDLESHRGDASRGERYSRRDYHAVRKYSFAGVA
jgi:hypothetical protein